MGPSMSWIVLRHFWVQKKQGGLMGKVKGEEKHFSNIVSLSLYWPFLYIHFTIAFRSTDAK